MKKTLSILALVHLHLFSPPLFAAVPLRWTVETSRVQPATFDVVRGETIALEASFNNAGKPFALDGYDCSIFWQTNCMGSAWWTAPAAAASNRVSATFTPEMDPGASTVIGFLGSTGQIYRASFQLRFRHGPGAMPNALPLPQPVIDFARVRVLNPPWLDGSNFVSRTELTAATNALDTGLRGEIAAATNGLRSVDGAARGLPKYLHALDFADSYPDAAAEYYRSRGDGKVDGGCSAVRDGGALYRNFDFPLDDRAEFVVTMAAGAGRFASVGVAQVGTNLTEAIVTSGKPSRCYKWLPGATVDGINERGVACNINVVDGDPQTSGWHTTGNLHPIGAIRWILDNATNAQHGAEYIAANIRFPDGWEQNFHYMIADERETWIVEDGTASNITGKVVMTNFPRLPPISSGMGIERYALLTDGANITNAWYTNAYRRETNPPWFSEFDNNYEYMNAAINAWDNGKGKESHRGETYTQTTYPFKTYSWWQTVHTSIYDLTHKTLRVAVQEEDDWYTFQVPSAGGIEEEIDPTVAWWARAGMPEPMTDLTPATNYTDAATNALAALIPGGYAPDPADPTFSSAVLAVNLGIDTNQVAALAELAGLPIGESAGTVGGLLLLLVAAVLALKRGKADGNKTYFSAGDGAECTGVGGATITGDATEELVTGSADKVITFTGDGTFMLPDGVTSARLVVVGGGGGGSYGNGGKYSGGGGGGVLDRTVEVQPGVPYQVTVGWGGRGGTTDTAHPNISGIGGNGEDSVVVIGDRRYVAMGGIGANNKGDGTATATQMSGRCPGWQITDLSMTAIESGGAHSGNVYGNTQGAGGASSAADAANKNYVGRDGTPIDVTGLIVKLGAGGGGSSSAPTATTNFGVGGADGGGAGGNLNHAEGVDGVANTGAGGGGGSHLSNISHDGGAGGSGVVYVRYTPPATAPRYGIAIGQNARSTAAHAMQIGEGVNDQPMTVKFHDYLMLKADGTIPEERMPNTMISHEDFAGVTELGAEFTDNEIGQKVDQIIRLLRGTTAAIIAALFVRGTFAASVTTAVKGEIPNTSNVVTAVDFAGLTTAEELRDATNATLVAANAYTDAHGGGVPSNVVYYGLSSAGDYTVLQSEKDQYNNPGPRTLMIGVSGASGENSFAQGFYTYARAHSASAMGYFCEATGNYAEAAGEHNKASGEAAHAEGGWNEASGRLSHAEGAENYATGECSHAEGWKTTAGGRAAHSAGVNANASSSYAWVWNGVSGGQNKYPSHGVGTFNLNPVAGLRGVYIGETNLLDHIVSISPRYVPRAEDPVFSNAVLAVGLKSENWGKYTSDGNVAPSNTVYISAGRTILAGGVEFDTIEIGGGSVGVLTSKGAPAVNYGDEGMFKIGGIIGTNFFGISNSEYYTIGCECHALTNRQAYGDQPQMLELVYNVTMEGYPVLWYLPRIEDYPNWEKLSLPDGSPIAGASVPVAWEQDPGPGRKVCYVNVGNADRGFFTATIEIGGMEKFVTNMPADLSGGVLCTDGHTIIYPHADGTWSTTK